MRNTPVCFYNASIKECSRRHSGEIQSRLNRRNRVIFMADYLITGACGGMGTALCRRLAEEGHRVWGLDRTPPKEQEPWTYVPADITSREDLLAAFEQVSAEAGALDGIIHMAGRYDLNSLVEMPEEDFLLDFDVNLFGMFRVNRRFISLLREKGRIVIVSSELAPLYPLPFTGIYAVTKTAVEKYAAALRMELQLLGHRVSVVRPGAVRTDMLPASTEKLDRFCDETRLYTCNAERFRKIVNKVEARNIPPEKVACLVSRILKAPKPRRLYCINRNPLLLLLNALPRRTQLWVIRRILS